jgi:hypothetical protein
MYISILKRSLWSLSLFYIDGENPTVASRVIADAVAKRVAGLGSLHSQDERRKIRLCHIESQRLR